MPDQYRLEIARIDVEAAGDDHVLLAIDENEKAVVVKAADVAGADEAQAVRVVPFGIARKVGPVAVAGHHAVRMSDDLAGAARGNLVTGFVDQANIVSGRRLADRMQLVRMRGAVEQAGTAAFGQSV